MCVYLNKVSIFVGQKVTNILKKGIMRNVETIFGEVTVTEARIRRSSGYGQYNIDVEFSFEEIDHKVSIHTTDSQLFDEANGEDDHFEIVMDGADHLIQRRIENHIDSI